MKDKSQEVTEQNSSIESNNNSEQNKSRRRVLKKAGVATSVVAVSAWVKPSLNTVILPAHAQTSMMNLMMSGGTSSDFTSNSKNRFNNIANKALNAIIPEAHAGLNFNGSICNAFIENGNDDNTHCVSLELDEAADDAGFTLTLTGPPIYYNFCTNYYDYYSGTYTAYYEGTKMFGSSVNGTLNGKNIEVLMGDVQFEGSVTDDFTSASGVLFINSRAGSVGIGSRNGRNSQFCSPGYGAYWETSSSGAACVIGTGVMPSSYSDAVGVNDSFCPR